MRHWFALALLVTLFVMPWILPTSQAQIHIALTPTASTPTVAAYLPVVIRQGATSTTGPTTVGTIAATQTATHTPTPSSTPTASPIASGPTRTPTLPPPTFNNCQAEPNPNAAPNYPVRIVAIDKSAETVTLQNVSGSTIDLAGWHMCSILGNQEHPVSGSLMAGQSRTFAGPAGNIWNNSQKDDGALYNPGGQLVSYFAD